MTRRLDSMTLRRTAVSVHRHPELVSGSYFPPAVTPPLPPSSHSSSSAPLRAKNGLTQRTLRGVSRLGSTQRAFTKMLNRVQHDVAGGRHNAAGGRHDVAGRTAPNPLIVTLNSFQGLNICSVTIPSRGYSAASAISMLCGPRTTMPGNAPVMAPLRNVTTPDFIVAT